MANEKVGVRFPPSQLRRLDKLGAKLGLDRSETIRYCVARIAEVENIPSK